MDSALIKGLQDLHAYHNPQNQVGEGGGEMLTISDFIDTLHQAVTISQWLYYLLLWHADKHSNPVFKP